MWCVSEGEGKLCGVRKKQNFTSKGAHPVLCSLQGNCEALTSWRGTWEVDVPKDHSQTTGLECIAQRDATDWVHPFK